MAENLQLAPPLPFLQSVSFNPSTVSSGTQATGTVTLTTPPQVIGAIVSLTSTLGWLANVPLTVTVQPGATSVTFPVPIKTIPRSEEHTSELQSLRHLVCRLLL